MTEDRPLLVTLSLILTDWALLVPLWETVFVPCVEEEEEAEAEPEEVETELPVLRTVVDSEPVLVCCEELEVPVVLRTVVVPLPEEEVVVELPDAEPVERLTVVVPELLLPEEVEEVLPVDLRTVVWPEELPLEVELPELLRLVTWLPLEELLPDELDLLVTWLPLEVELLRLVVWPLA